MKNVLNFRLLLVAILCVPFFIHSQEQHEHQWHRKDKQAILDPLIKPEISTKPEATGQELLQEGTILRILSFNIHHGTGTSGIFNLSRITDIIRNADPDLVALQEIDSKTNRVNGRDLTAALAQKLQMYAIFGKAIDFAGGEYGQVILSRNSFLSTRKLNLPGQAEKESRIAVEAVIALDSGDTIHFIGTHLDHTAKSPDRIRQAKKLNRILPEAAPAILAGDLNDLPGSDAINHLETRWGSSYEQTAPIPTYPSDSPKKKIDYIMFYPPGRWKVLDSEVICDKNASDHCALLVEMQLQP